MSATALSCLAYPVRRSRLPLACLPLALLTAIFSATADDNPGPQVATTLDRVQVVSTATRTEHLLAEVPIRTEVLRAEEIALRGGGDFSRAVELMNGIRVESNCQNCNTSDVHLLGLEGAYNQLLFDGAPLMSTLGGVYGIEQIPAAFINRIEVVKGGGSALYGPGAVAGVVNLISATPTRSGGFVESGVEWQKGEPMTHATARGDLVRADGRGGISFVGQYAHNDVIDFDGDEYSEITEKRLRVAGFQGFYAPTDTSTVRTNYTYTREHRRGGNRLDAPEWLANITEALETEYHRGGLHFDQIINDGFDFSLGYSFAYVKRNSYYGGLGDVVTDPNDPDFDPDELDPTIPGSAAESAFNQYGYTENPLHYLDSQFNLRRGNHAVAFGVQYKRETIRDEQRNARGERTIGGENGRFTNLGGYIQDEWTVSDRLDLVLGARVDKPNTLDNAIFSPRIALAFQATPEWMLRAGISTGFRAPEVFDEDLHVDTLGAEQVRIRNADGLDEERAVTAMLGVDWRSPDGRLSWDATASWTDLKDAFALSEIRTDDVTGELYQLRENTTGSSIKGVETNLGWQASERMRMGAGLAWYSSRYDESQVIFDDTEDDGETVLDTARYLKNPGLTGQAQVLWSPTPMLDTFVGVKYTGRMWALNNRTAELNHTDDFWVMDAGGVIHLGEHGPQHWDVSFGVRNIFDQRQKDLEIGAERDNDYVYGPRFARSYYLSARFHF